MSSVKVKPKHNKEGAKYYMQHHTFCVKRMGHKNIFFNLIIFTSSMCYTFIKKSTKNGYLLRGNRGRNREHAFKINYLTWDLKKQNKLRN